MDINNAKLQDAIDSKLLGTRKVFLWGQVDDKSARHVVDRLLYLELMEPGKEIQLIINSPGGYVTSGFAIYDTMVGISSPVSTICAGLAASMGAILLSAGEKGRRFALPHARVMIHQPSGGAGGSAAEITIQIEELLKTKQLGAEILARNCGQSVEKILKDFNRDYWMSAEESVDYGIVDAKLEKLL
ncbi:MAG: ATP-dependent Clp protease proteolytic subunit [Lewinellaceae bacterium]|nr:ATP-dependent Clp protease proteolytic subunit [Saprospiraceae bacterium]MCB9332901.1 ATP-dependent Clp protease proteolytic subunit [Lewinellaceae bacterium]